MRYVVVGKTLAYVPEWSDIDTGHVYSFSTYWSKHIEFHWEEEPIDEKYIAEQAQAGYFFEKMNFKFDQVTSDLQEAFCFASNNLDDKSFALLNKEEQLLKFKEMRDNLDRLSVALIKKWETFPSE